MLAGEKVGHSPENLKMGLHSLGYVAYSPQDAIEDYYPGYIETFSRIGTGRDRTPLTQAYFNAHAGPTSALFVRRAEEIAALWHSGEFHGLLSKCIIQVYRMEKLCALKNLFA